MKKILIFVVIFSFLIGLSGVALAQSDLNECCKTRQKITGVGTEILADVFVGPSLTANCDWNGNGTVDTGETLGTAPNTPLGGSGHTERTDWGMICMLNTIYTVTNWIFYILTLLAVLMIIYGGFVYITAAGDPAKATSGKGILTFAIIGLAIALLAKFIPSLVRFILGV